MDNKLFIVVVSLIMFALFSNLSRANEPLLWGFAIDGYPVTAQRLKEIETETGLTADIIVFFLQWPSAQDNVKTYFPLTSLEIIWNAGAVPCITWEPMYYKDNREIVIPYGEILNGNYDSYILGFAGQAKSWGKPLMIRFAHEMNIERYHWGTDKDSYGPESPKVYKQMFQYIVSIFKKAGANNVLWVFCPNAESVPNTSYDKRAGWNKISNYYPGDDYVNIFGVDGYNWGTTQKKETHKWDSQWKGFKEIFQLSYEELLFISPHKPVIIFETATVNNGGSKSTWIKDALETATAWGIKGVNWFQENKELDWRINSQNDNAYQNVIRKKTSYPQYWIDNILKGISR